MGPQFVLAVLRRIRLGWRLYRHDSWHTPQSRTQEFCLFLDACDRKLSTSRSLRSFASGLLLRETKRQLRASSRVPPLPRSSRHQIFLKLFHRNPERKRRMKNIRFHKTIKSVVSRLRIAAAGVLLLGPRRWPRSRSTRIRQKLPWSGPTVNVGINPVTNVVDQATHTVYVANVAE